MSADEPGGPRHRSGVIPIAGPWITEREVDAVADAARDSWYEHAYDDITGFETGFAAMPTGACDRDAVVHGRPPPLLDALGVGPATRSSCPRRRGSPRRRRSSTSGRPRCSSMSIPSLGHRCRRMRRRRSTSRTKAMILVDLYGGMPDMAALKAFAPSGTSPSSRIRPRPWAPTRWARAGGFGIASIFSFHGSKTLTTHEGGMVLSDDDHLSSACSSCATRDERPALSGSGTSRSAGSTG